MKALPLNSLLININRVAVSKYCSISDIFVIVLLKYIISKQTIFSSYKA